MGKVSVFRAKMAGWLRRDWLVVVLFAVAVVVMTHPLAFDLSAGLANRGEQDIFAILWQVWWLGEVVENGHDPNFTPYLFFPNGLDVTFQERHWAALGVWLPLRSLLGDIAGFNLSALIGLLASAYTAYLLVLHLTDDRLAAWVGGAFYAFYPAHMTRLFSQPVSGSIQWVPLFMLALVVGLERIASATNNNRIAARSTVTPMALAAGALALNAYVGVKPWMQSVVLGALYAALAGATNGWWRRPRFWIALGVLAVLSLVLALPVLSPFLLAGSDLRYSIAEEADELIKRGADLLAYVKAAPELPVFMPRSLAQIREIEYTKWFDANSFHLGLTSIVLATLGIWHVVGRDRRRLIWPVIALVLWGFSLGTRLEVGGVRYPSIWMPYRLVAWNPFFQAIRAPYRFALGFSLPWAVLIGTGVAFLRRRLARHEALARGVVVCATALMLFELSEVPIPLDAPPGSPFYSQVLAADEQEGAIIDLPMGRRQSKQYMYLQTHHGRPIVEGVVARTPLDAYDYIAANPLLRAWRDNEPLACDDDVGQAIDDLHADGFRYVIVHRSKLGKWMREYFADVTPLYQDDIIVYRLDDLRSAPLCAGA